MTTNTTQKAAGATNSNGPHTDTNGINFGTEDTPSKAIAPPIAPSLDKAAILAALAKPIEPPDLCTFQPLTTKKRIKTVMGGTAE